MVNNLNNWRFLLSLGGLLLVAGLLVNLFVHFAPGMANNLSHAVAGFLCGMSIVFLIRAVWLRRKNTPHLQS